MYVFRVLVIFMFFFFKQKTAYEMRISDWSSDVCSSDLRTMRIMIATSAVLGLCACTTTPAELREREVVGTFETTKPANDVAACLAEAFSKVGPPVILDKNGSKIVEFHSSNIY